MRRDRTALYFRPSRLVHHGLHLRDSGVGGRPVGGFGDDAHDRLGVARPGVDPGVGPVDADAVLRVDLFRGELPS